MWDPVPSDARDPDSHPSPPVWRRPEVSPGRPPSRTCVVSAIVPEVLGRRSEGLREVFVLRAAEGKYHLLVRWSRSLG